jgi:hypothetical protein
MSLSPSYADISGSIADEEMRRDIVLEFNAERALPERPTPRGAVEDLPKAASSPITETTLQKVLRVRRTYRRFRVAPIDRTLLSSLLEWGLESVRKARSRAMREGLDGASRSFGCAHNVFIHLHNVGGMEPGTAFYDLDHHRLIRVKVGDTRSSLAAACHSQFAPVTAAVSFVFTVNWESYYWRYRHERALRNLYIETGRIVQGLLHAIYGASLGAFITPAIKESLVAADLEIDCKRECPLYVVSVGWPRIGSSSE